MDVVLASRNPRKLRELKEILAPRGWTLSPVDAYDHAEVDEPAPTFVENALLKARHACAVSGKPAIADDSGLEVDALGGAPGVHSARYAGEHGNDTANNAKLLKALADVPEVQRGARFVCVIVYLRHADDPTPVIASGYWCGHILTAPRGRDGFGYDPVFWVPKSGCSAAELDAAAKHRLSHRGQALRQLCDLLKAPQSTT
ncbi:MAG TPA: RdgB/HAM1 family non-canonical purine NTP pyrophosphatase [Nevskiaceae bacterium]|nr:RdgB/HAM1 family non-canonical purine NTP pyrophosphatase [Nevskiaceae bacterium]